MKRILILTSDNEYGHRPTADASKEGLQEIQSQVCKEN